ncbi:MAG: 16S rRNA (guanine(527)-N(7))-methyltransferase RsmG [Acidimicrobiales bacterium]
MEHASLFGRAIGSAECRFADIGAGGGVPGLPMLMAQQSLSAVLIDASQKRCSFLVWAVAELGLSDRAEVWCGRAEEIARQTRARRSFDAVVARGFGPPAVTLECGAPLLVDGGRIVVSEPPVPRRWPVEPLQEMGLVQVSSPQGVAVFERRGPLPDSLPRLTKHLKRSPLFEID